MEQQADEAGLGTIRQAGFIFNGGSTTTARLKSNVHGVSRRSGFSRDQQALLSDCFWKVFDPHLEEHLDLRSTADHTGPTGLIGL